MGADAPARDARLSSHCAEIGAWDIAPTHLAKHGYNQSVAAYATLAHSSVERHVLRANRRDGLTVDTFLHSWNPEVGASLDALYTPNASLHQEPVHAFERVRSGHLSLKRVLLLLRAHEVPGDEVSLVMVSRFDVLWYTDLLLRGLSPSRILLPHVRRTALPCLRRATDLDSLARRAAGPFSCSPPALGSTVNHSLASRRWRTPCCMSFAGAIAAR